MSHLTSIGKRIQSRLAASQISVMEITGDCNMENLDRAQLSVENNDEIEIDLREVFHVLWRKLWALILFLVVGACIAGAATMHSIRPPPPSICSARRQI